jgi:hypothetical protein
MTDDATDSSGLPPKINVRKPKPLAPAEPKAAEPAAAKPVADEAPTVKLAPKPTLKPVVKPAGKGPRPLAARPASPVAKPVARPSSSPAAPVVKPDAENAAVKAAGDPAPAAAPVKPRTIVAKPAKQPSVKPAADASGATPVKPRTIVAKPVGKADAESPSVRVAAKRETTKIPLDSARPDPKKGKTVSAKPVAVPTVKAKLPKSKAATADAVEVSPEEAAKQATAAASKRTTSRISLEAVLGADSDGEEGGPKTIRLKRPGATAGGKVVASATVRKKPVGDTAKTVRASTAETSDGSGDVSATQRKTVVVKKPGARRPSGRAKVSVARAGGDGEAGAAASPASVKNVSKGPSEPGWIFTVYTLAAVLMTCVLIYVITAQVVGPNASLTEYSYSKTGPDLPWPGKLAGPRSY